MCDSPISLLVVSVASLLRIPAAASRAAPTSSLGLCAALEIPLRRKPATPRGLGETETWGWEALADEPGQQPESPSLDSLRVAALGGGRACPYIPWQGGAAPPFLRVGPRLPRLSHWFSSQSGVGT